MSALFPTDRRTALLVIGGLVVVVGLGGLLASRSLDLTEANGALVVDVPDDFMWGRQLAFNPLGAIVTALLGVLMLGVGVTRSRALAVVAAAASALMALTSFVQLSNTEQIFGARAGNVALLVAATLALLAIALTPVVDDAHRSASVDGLEQS